MFRIEDISLENFYNQTNNAYNFFKNENSKNIETFSIPNGIVGLNDMKLYKLDFDEQQYNSVMDNLNKRAIDLTIPNLLLRKLVFTSIRRELGIHIDISMNDISKNDISYNNYFRIPTTENERIQLVASLQYYIYTIDLFLNDIKKVESPLNIQGKWDDWRLCDASCNGIDPYKIGRTNRIYRMQDISNNYNNTIESETSCVVTCPINCKGEWSNWSNCEANCTNNASSIKGKRTRTYNILTQPVNSGSACEFTNGYIQTDLTCDKTCPVNCEGNWEEWSTCEPNIACNGKDPLVKGKIKRKYIVTKPAINGGLSCIKENNYIETEECDSKCAVDSMFFWMTIAFGVPLLLIILYLVYTKFIKSNGDDGDGGDGDGDGDGDYGGTRTHARTHAPAAHVAAAYAPAAHAAATATKITKKSR